MGFKKAIWGYNNISSKIQYFMEEGMRRSKSKSGFTLIELLVVIAIISILAAILFPVFARARENARRASCLSNLKQIGLGIMQYTQDFDEHYPPAYDGTFTPPVYNPQTTPGTPGKIYATDGTVGRIGWMDMIFPYVKSVQIFQCPSQPSAASKSHASSYGYNGAISGYDADRYGKSATLRNIGITLATVQRPSEVAMVFDDQNGYNISNTPYAFAQTTDKIAGNDKTISPHFQGTNIAFADGHAKWMKTSSMVGSYTNLTYGYTGSDSAYMNPLWNPFIG
jgi:prepilin-type N-terminal cleavage/methylation domain-containing protein/prepilin-type processing-associated H-X9-DG protein